MPPELDAPGDERVQVRGPRLRVAPVEADVVPAEVVGEDDEDVGVRGERGGAGRRENQEREEEQEEAAQHHHHGPPVAELAVWRQGGHAGRGRERASAQV